MIKKLLGMGVLLTALSLSAKPLDELVARVKKMHYHAPRHEYNQLVNDLHDQDLTVRDLILAVLDEKRIKAERSMNCDWKFINEFREKYILMFELCNLYLSCPSVEKKKEYLRTIAELNNEKFKVVAYFDWFVDFIYDFRIPLSHYFISNYFIFQSVDKWVGRNGEKNESPVDFDFGNSDERNQDRFVQLINREWDIKIPRSARVKTMEKANVFANAALRFYIPTITFREGFERYSDNALVGVMGHEKMHIQCGHCAVKLFINRKYNMEVSDKYSRFWEHEATMLLAVQSTRNSECALEMERSLVGANGHDDRKDSHPSPYKRCLWAKRIYILMSVEADLTHLVAEPK